MYADENETKETKHSAAAATAAAIARQRMSKWGRSNVQSGLIKTLMWHTWPSAGVGWRYYAIKLLRSDTVMPPSWREGEEREVAGIVSRAQNFDVKIIKCRDTRARGISSGIIWALSPSRWMAIHPWNAENFPLTTCRGNDRSMAMQECERAGFFVPYGRLALRFFRELHN